MLLIGITSKDFAQNANQPKEDLAGIRAKNLTQVLTASKTAGLDAAQVEKVKAIIEGLYKKQDEINNDASLSADAKKEKLKQANADKDWKIQNAMGEKYQAYVDARKK